MKLLGTSLALDPTTNVNAVHLQSNLSRNVTYASNKGHDIPIHFTSDVHVECALQLFHFLSPCTCTCFNTSQFQVINESYMHNVPKGSETHFKVVVVSGKFEEADKRFGTEREAKTARFEEMKQAVVDMQASW